MKLSILLMAVILMLAAWFYRPAGYYIKLDPRKAAYIVAEKGITEHQYYVEHWVRLVTRGEDWGAVLVWKEDWDQLAVGDGFGGNIFRKGY